MNRSLHIIYKSNFYLETLNNFKFSRRINTNFLHLNRHFSVSTQHRTCKYDVVVVGAGIIGLTTALEMKNRYPDASVCVVEKECQIVSHQSQNNSGVIHAGIYYKPNSLRARLCLEGVELMYKFCKEHNIAFARNGKLIVAVENKELKWLDNLYIRGNENKVPGLELLMPDQYRELEPLCAGLKALWSPNTGIVEFGDVARKCAEIFQTLGGKIRTSFQVARFEEDHIDLADEDADHFPILVVSNYGKSVRARFVLTCAGLQADRVSQLNGGDPFPQIVPFRGQYFELTPEKQHLIRTNIYPVPDPSMPFIGVHFTPKTNGKCWLGPTAMIAVKREGYVLTDVDVHDCMELLKFRGLWIFVHKYFRHCVYEVLRSSSKRIITKELQAFVPSITITDVIPGGAVGIQAQAMNNDGTFAEDFNLEKVGNIYNCRNMPSPACTSSLAIAKYLADECEGKY